MKKSSFTEQQILAILKQREGGVPVPDLAREHGINNATYCNWRSEQDGMDASFCRRISIIFPSESRDRFTIQAHLLQAGP